MTNLIGERLLTIDQIADLVADERENIIEFLREDRIMYIIAPDGILIPLGAFQVMMPELYDLKNDLAVIKEMASGLTEEQVDAILHDLFSNDDD